MAGVYSKNDGGQADLLDKMMQRQAKKRKENSHHENAGESWLSWKKMVIRVKDRKLW